MKVCAVVSQEPSPKQEERLKIASPAVPCSPKRLFQKEKKETKRVYNDRREKKKTRVIGRVGQRVPVKSSIDQFAKETPKA